GERIPLKETNSTTGRGPSGNRAGMKRAATTAGLLWLGCLVAGCGGGRASVERHPVFVREAAPENAGVWIADADGRHAHRRPRGLRRRLLPGWSPARLCARRTRAGRGNLRRAQREGHDLDHPRQRRTANLHSPRLRLLPGLEPLMRAATLLLTAPVGVVLTLA